MLRKISVMTFSGGLYSRDLHQVQYHRRTCIQVRLSLTEVQFEVAEGMVGGGHFPRFHKASMEVIPGTRQTYKTNIHPTQSLRIGKPYLRIQPKQMKYM